MSEKDFEAIRREKAIKTDKSTIPLDFSAPVRNEKTSPRLDFYEADMLAFFLNLYRKEFRKECKKFGDYSNEYIDGIITKVAIICQMEATK